MLSSTSVGAVLLAIAAFPAAHAQIDLNAGASSAASLSTRSQEISALPRSGSTTENAGEGASLGGAVFSPFAEPPKSSAAHRTSAERALAANEPDFTLTLVVVLAAATALGWLLRRAWNAD